jgi:tyrosine-specific transport protein
MNKKLFSAAFTLTGTIIGAGILGLPYVFSQSGFMIGLFWLISLGALMLLTYLYIGEVALRTRGRHQLPGLAEKHLGKKGKHIMVLAMMFGLYASLLAYLIGEGQSLSLLITGTSNYALYFTLVFWILLTILLEGGLERLKKVESYGVIIIILIILFLFFNFLPNIKIDNLTTINTTQIFLPLGVTLFALLGFTSIPELREELRGNEKLLKWAIPIGVTIPIILYIIFSLSFVGVLGESVSQIATLSFGPFVIVLGIFTMLTSYFVLSFSIKDMCKYDLFLGKKATFFLKSIVPLILFIILYTINWTSFIQIIGIGGVISGGTVGILGVFMNYKAKKQKGRKPEYSIYINKTIVAVITFIFIVGIILQIYYTI